MEIFQMFFTNSLTLLYQQMKSNPPSSFFTIVSQL